MVTRADYLNDPNVPKATTIAIAAVAFVLDDADRLLMIRRADNGLYALPGGRHELGETMTGTAVRETFEETGVTHPNPPPRPTANQARPGPGGDNHSARPEAQFRKDSRYSSGRHAPRRGRRMHSS